MPRRKPGTLLPIELEILGIAAEWKPGGFHGFALAKAMGERAGSRSLTAHGTLYKALGRLEERGLLRSHWEMESEPGRPRRRLYQVTPEGAAAAAAAGGPVSAAVTRPSPVPRIA